METDNLRDLSKDLHLLLKAANLEQLSRNDILNRLDDIVTHLDNFIEYIEVRE